MNEQELTSELSRHVSKEEIVALTRELVAIPSHWETPGQEKAVVHALENFFKQQKMDYELQLVEGDRNNIIARVPGKGKGRSLALNGHLDTVPPYDMTVEPFGAFMEDGKVYGRGTNDMKGPVAAMIYTLLAFKRSGLQLEGDLYFTGVLAEETTSDGSEALIESGFEVDGALVGEPSNREYAIGHRGLEWLEFEITGKTAHGGIPEAGVNAIGKAAKFITRVEETIIPRLKELQHPYMGPSVMNFGLINGGQQPSTVADRCIIQLDRRYTPQEKLADVLKEYQDIIDDLALEDPDFKAVMRRMESNLMKKYDHVPMETPPDDPLVEDVKSALQYITKEPPRLTTRRGWTDAAILNFYGNIATVVYGPGNISRSHSPDEYITVDELFEGFLVYALVAAKYCGLAS